MIKHVFMILLGFSAGMLPRAFSQPGCSWTPFPSGPDASISDLAVYDFGTGPSLYAGGYFSTVGGVSAAAIARWDGSVWSSVGAPLIGAGSPPVVGAMQVYDDGTGPALYVGGSFAGAGGLALTSIGKWDGISWSALGSGLAPHPGENVVVVGALAVFDDGSGLALYVAGRFGFAGGVPAANVARWDGINWSALGGGLAGEVSAMRVLDDGSGPALYAGVSNFLTPVPGSLNAAIARWDGTSWSVVGSGVSGPVWGAAVFDDGNGPALYISNDAFFSFTNPTNDILKWDGTTWTNVGVVGGIAMNLETLDDGRGPALFVGGQTVTVNGSPTPGMARFDG